MNQVQKILEKYLFRKNVDGWNSAYENAYREMLEKVRPPVDSFESLKDAIKELFDYFEVYYNPIRRYLALVYEGSDIFEQIYN